MIDEDILKKGLHPLILMKRSVFIPDEEFGPDGIPKMIHYECILRGENVPTPQEPFGTCFNLLIGRVPIF